MDTKILIHKYDFGKKNEVWSMKFINDAQSKMLVLVANYEKDVRDFQLSIIDFDRLTIESTFSLETAIAPSFEISAYGDFIIVDDLTIYDFDGNIIIEKEMHSKCLVTKKRFSIKDVSNYKELPPTNCLIDVSTGEEIVRVKFHLFDNTYCVSNNNKYFIASDDEYLVIRNIKDEKEVFRSKRFKDCSISLTYDKNRNRAIFTSFSSSEGCTSIKAIQLPD